MFRPSHGLEGNHVLVVVFGRPDRFRCHVTSYSDSAEVLLEEEE